MKQEYNTIVAQLSAISWQLKRIADALEAKPEPAQLTKPSIKNGSKLKDFLDKLDAK